MERFADLSLGKLTALFTLIAVGAIIYLTGQQMFSPGALNAQSRQKITRGGVASHAEIGGQCSACHVPPWSSETMANRCQTCHTEVRAQIDSKQGMHGLLPGATECRSCHTEHHGAQAALTSPAGLAHFDHSGTAFPLTGQHRTVDCKACHLNNVYKSTPQSCAACHAEPKVHKGHFGTDCAKCHSTATWEGATFAHRFPLTHGGGKKPKDCSLCHPNATDYKTYTCYGCHEHSPTKMADKHVRKGIPDFQDCTRCHPTGRKERRKQAQADDPPLEQFLTRLEAGEYLPALRPAKLSCCFDPYDWLP